MKLTGLFVGSPETLINRFGRGMVISLPWPKVIYISNVKLRNRMTNLSQILYIVSVGKADGLISLKLSM